MKQVTLTNMNPEQELDVLYQPKPTNTARVAAFMDYGSPINQMFVIEAICKYANQVLDNEQKVLENMAKGFISGEAWVQCAKDWKAKYPEYFRKG